MITIDNLDSINAIKEDDLSKINTALFESFYINNISIKESLVDYKEDIIETFSELLKKMLFKNLEMSKESKLNIINFLDKLSTQKENLEMIKSKTSISDIQEASKRLSKKSQSAFELKH
jgi:hypothetical protein